MAAPARLSWLADSPHRVASRLHATLGGIQRDRQPLNHVRVDSFAFGE